MQSGRSFEPRNGETTGELIIAESIATFYNKPILLFLLFSSSFLRHDEIHANGRLLRGKASLRARDRLPFQKLNERGPRGGKPSKRTNYIRLICARRMLCVCECARDPPFSSKGLHRVGYLRLVFVISPPIFVLPARRSFGGVRGEAFNGNVQPKSFVHSGNEREVLSERLAPVAYICIYGERCACMQRARTRSCQMVGKTEAWHREIIRRLC